MLESTNSNAGSRNLPAPLPHIPNKENVLKNNIIPQPSKRAILYARVSGDDRKYATSSIESQLTDCRNYANSRGFCITGEVFEEPEKHTSGADRLPELNQLLQQAASGAFDVLIVREIDRLARNRFKQMATEIELEAHGVTVEYVIGQYEDTPEGRLLKGLMAEFAEYEREKIRQRTLRGQIASVKAGNISTGGSGAPYGYRLVLENDRRTLVVDEAEAEVVQLIFDLYAVKLKSLYEISEELQRRAFPRPGKGTNHQKAMKKSDWAVSTIQRILTNETYSGRWHYGKVQKRKHPQTGKLRAIHQDRSTWIELPAPVLISPPLFAAVQERRQANKRLKGRQRKHTYLLGGMIRCDQCRMAGVGLTRTRKGKEYRYYLCNAHANPKAYVHRCAAAPFRADPIEAAVWEHVWALISEPEKLKEIIETTRQNAREGMRPQLSMLESNRKHRANLLLRQTRLQDAYEEGVYTLAQIAPRQTALAQELATVEQAIEQLEQEIGTQGVSDDGETEMLSAATEIRAAFASDEPPTEEEKRKLLELLKTQVWLIHENGQQYVDVESDFLGHQRLSVGSRTTDHTQHHWPIRSRLMIDDGCSQRTIAKLAPLPL